MFKIGKYFRKIIQLCIWFLWKLATIWPLVWLTRNKRLRFLTKRFSSKKNVGKFCNCHVVPNLKDLAKSYSEFDKWFANLVNEDEESEQEEEEEEDDRESAKTDTESEEDLVVVNEQTPLQKSFKSTSQDNLNCHQVKLDYQLLLYRACIKGKVAILDVVVENFGIEKTKQLLEEPAPPPSKPKDSKIDSGLTSDSGTKPITKDPFEKMNDNQDDIYQSWPKLPAIHLAILFDHFSLITYLLAELKCPLTIDDQRFDLNSLMFGALINDRHTSVRSYDMILRAYLYGVDPNEQNREGYTALHFATKRNNCQAVKLLLRIGADVRLVNHRGETAADIAKQLGNKAIYRLLVDGLDSDQQQSKFKLGFLQHCLWSARLFRSFPHYRIYVLCILVGSVFTSFELLLCFGYLLPLYLTDYLIQLGDLFWTHCAMLLALFSVTATAFMTFYCDPGYCERKSKEYVETLGYLIENRLDYPFPPPSSLAISTESLTNETKHNSEQQDSNNIVDNCGDICRESMFVSVDDKPKAISRGNRICCSPVFDQLIGARRRLMEIYEEDRHFCHICESVVSIYWSVSKHCYICDRCVARFDHHCVFLFNCIGSKNFASFVSFNLLFAYVGISGAAILGIGIQRKLAYPIDARIQPEPYEVSWDTFSSLDEFANFMLLVPYRDFFNLLIMVKFCVLCTILACSSLFRRYWLNR